MCTFYKRAQKNIKTCANEKKLKLSVWFWCRVNIIGLPEPVIHKLPIFEHSKYHK